MVSASKNEIRGSADDFSVEDVACFLGLDDEAVKSILGAMQGKVLEGMRLTGWEKRQPKREDHSTERVRKHRETQCNALKRKETPREDTDTDTDTDKDKEQNTPPISPPGEEKRRKRRPPKTDDGKVQFAEFVSLTNEEHSSLVAELGEHGARRCIEILDNYKGATGKKYKSDYRAIKNWVIGRYRDEQTKDQAKTSTMTGREYLRQKVRGISEHRPDREAIDVFGKCIP